jgi:hypothetical protein
LSGVSFKNPGFFLPWEQEREFFPLTMTIGRGGGGALGSFFGRKDEEDVMDPFLNSLFANINQQMGRIIQTIPKVHYFFGVFRCGLPYSESHPFVKIVTY